MNTYDVYFRSDLQWGMREFIADTPEKALELVRKFAGENSDGLVLDCESASNFDPFPIKH
jgi:hypothetical protein